MHPEPSSCARPRRRFQRQLVGRSGCGSAPPVAPHATDDATPVGVASRSPPRAGWSRRRRSAGPSGGSGARVHAGSARRCRGAARPAAPARHRACPPPTRSPSDRHRPFARVDPTTSSRRVRGRRMAGRARQCRFSKGRLLHATATPHARQVGTTRAPDKAPARRRATARRGRHGVTWPGHPAHEPDTSGTRRVGATRPPAAPGRPRIRSCAGPRRSSAGRSIENRPQMPETRRDPLADPMTRTHAREAASVAHRAP